MGKEFFLYEDCKNVYVCKECKNHLSSKSKVMTKSFKGKHGRSFLVSRMINVTYGAEEEKILLSGIHCVKDVMCKRCTTYIGWFYVKAYEATEKYKEGHFVLERNLVLKADWD
jgi:hypothetical protein